MPGLKKIVNFILKFYGPLFFNIKKHSNITHGALHYFEALRLARTVLSTEKVVDKKEKKKKMTSEQEIIMTVLKRNCFFGTIESIILAMLFSQNKKERRSALNLARDSCPAYKSGSTL